MSKLAIVALIALFGSMTVYDARGLFAQRPPTKPKPIYVVIERPAPDVQRLGGRLCSPHGGLIGYYVPLFTPGHYAVDCADGARLNDHGMRF